MVAGSSPAGPTITYIKNNPMDVKLIKVWAFYDAPKELQALSPHGGDEDWLALVPPNYPSGYISWLQSGSSFGCCDVSVHVTDLGTVYIGAHA
jgi:hypothetical protein